MKNTDTDELTKSQVLQSTIFQHNLRKKWVDAEAQITDHNLKIMGHPVMEDWEHPYMEALAKVVSRPNGRVLEVGFGMGISASYIQNNNIEEHFIIEANREVAIFALKAIENYQNKTIITCGYSNEVTPTLRDNYFDGILYDTYPLSKEDICTHHREFFNDAYRILKPGGIFTYYCNHDSKIPDEDLCALRREGFSDISWKLIDVTPPQSCEYWKYKQFVAPICIK